MPVGDAGLPFAAVVEALRGVIRTLGRPGFEALAGPGRAELARLVPDLAPSAAPAATEPSAGGWAQARLFELLLGFLGRLAARSPVVLVIEDLHWADEATRDLVAYLVHIFATSELLLVATYRSDDLHRRHPLMPLLAELRRSPRVERIDLVPFDRDELAEQLAGILGREPEPSLVAEIAERSEGNAYLAEELAAVGPAARLPGTVEEVLLARVGRLSEAAQDVLRVASAAGPRIDIGSSRRSRPNRRRLARGDPGARRRARPRPPRRRRDRGALRVPPRPAPGGRLRPAAARPSAPATTRRSRGRYPSDPVPSTR